MYVFIHAVFPPPTHVHTHKHTHTPHARRHTHTHMHTPHMHVHTHTTHARIHTHAHAQDMPAVPPPLPPRTRKQAPQGIHAASPLPSPHCMMYIPHMHAGPLRGGKPAAA